MLIVGYQQDGTFRNFGVVFEKPSNCSVVIA